MPVLRIRYGYNVWWSDRCSPKPDELKIRADAKPLDEVWRLVQIASLIRIAWSKAWAYTCDDIEDLQQTTYLVTYKELLRRVREGKYDRSVSLYLNIRSCCWAVYQHHMNNWMDRIRQKMSLVDAWATVGHDDHVGHGNDMCIYDKVPNGAVRLVTDSESRDYSRHLTWKTMTRKRDQHVRLKKEVKEQYDLYCESCLELNTEPMPYDDFISSNLTEEEMEVLHYTPSKKAIYNHRYWMKHRAKQKCRRPRETHNSDDGQ